MNPLFERLSLQGHLRRIIDQYGDQGWEIIQLALEREVGYTERLEATRAQKTAH